MKSSKLYLLAADSILILHFVFVVFVILSLVLILVGKFRHWHWVRNRRFRMIHLCAIGIVVIQSWLGEICFLTKWEMNLREAAGDAVYTGAFIAHWLESLLYYQAPAWVFMVCYTLFALIVIASWYWVPPNSGSRT